PPGQRCEPDRADQSGCVPARQSCPIQERKRGSRPAHRRRENGDDCRRRAAHYDPAGPCSLPPPSALPPPFYSSVESSRCVSSSSRPCLTSVCQLPQRGHRSTQVSESKSRRHPMQKSRAGTLSISSFASAAGVFVLSASKAKVNASGTTPDKVPTRSRRR